MHASSEGSHIEFNGKHLQWSLQSSVEESVAPGCRAFQHPSAPACMSNDQLAVLVLNIWRTSCWLCHSSLAPWYKSSPNKLNEESTWQTSFDGCPKGYKIKELAKYISEAEALTGTQENYPSFLSRLPSLARNGPKMSLFPVIHSRVARSFHMAEGADRTVMQLNRTNYTSK